MKISFTVLVKPQPQGSIRAFLPKGWKRPVLTSDNPNLKTFRGIVADAALAACPPSGGFPFPRPMAVTLVAQFSFAKPKSAPKGQKYHTKKPDLDKLMRAVADALTGVVYEDDSQIHTAVLTKEYGDEGIHITVEGEA